MPKNKSFPCPTDCQRIGIECICCVAQYLGLPALVRDYAAGSKDPNAVVREYIKDIPEEEVKEFLEEFLLQEGLAPIQ